MSGRDFFNGRKVLITGATRGIGRQAVVHMLEQGAEVLAVARSEAALAELAAEAPGRVHVLAADLGQPDMARAVARWVADEHPGCSGLINNAAMMVHTRFTEPTAESAVDAREDEIAGELTLNLVAPLTLAAHMLPVLRRSGQGFIANVTSGLAIAPLPNAVTYSASKAGLACATRGLRSQLRQAGRPMQLTEVVMTLVDTTLSQGAPSAKMAPEEAARQMLAGIAAGRKRVFVGKTKLLAAIDRLSPALADRIIAGRAPKPDQPSAGLAAG